MEFKYKIFFGARVTFPLDGYAQRAVRFRRSVLPGWHLLVLARAQPCSPKNAINNQKEPSLLILTRNTTAPAIPVFLDFLA